MLYIVGCGRSGTKHTVALLQALGVMVDHESSGPDGEVGWRGLLKTLDGDLSLESHRVLHQVRNPLETISSLRTHTNALLESVSRHFPTNSRLETTQGKLHRCMEYWYHWNLLAEQSAQWTFAIETLPANFAQFCQQIGLESAPSQYPTISTTLNTRRTARFASLQAEPLSWSQLRAIDQALCENIISLARRYGYDESYLEDTFEVRLDVSPVKAAPPKKSITRQSPCRDEDSEGKAVGPRIYISSYLLQMPQVRSITESICDQQEFFNDTEFDGTEQSWSLAWGYPSTKRRFGVAETGFFWDAMHIDTQGLYQFSSLNSVAGFRAIQDFEPPESGASLIREAPLPASKYRQPDDHTTWNGVVFACQNPSDRSIHSVASTEDWWRFLRRCCQYYGKSLFIKLHPWNSGEVEMRIRDLAISYGCECGKVGHSVIDSCDHVVLFNSTFAVDCMTRGIPVKQAAPGYFSGTGAVSMCDGDPRRTLLKTERQASQLVDFLVWRYCFSMDCSLDAWKQRLRRFATSTEMFPLALEDSYGCYLQEQVKKNSRRNMIRSAQGASSISLVSSHDHVPVISFCTTCKGRLHHLRETLPANLEANAVYFPHIEFILLDYDSQDGLADWVADHLQEHLRSGLVTYYRMTDREYFHTAHAKNVAHLLSKGEIICNLDADNYLDSELVLAIREVFQSNSRSIIRGKRRCTRGRIVINRCDFLTLGGYNEEMQGYGHEDNEFVRRGTRYLGLKRHALGRFDKYISHSHTERAMNSPFKSIRESNRINRALMQVNLQRGQLVANQGRLWGEAVVERNFSGELIPISSVDPLDKDEMRKLRVSRLEHDGDA